MQIGNKVRRFNEWVAVRATLVFGTMWAFYVFLLYGVLPIVDPAHSFQYLNWSNWAQLWSLPLIMVGQTVMGRAAVEQAKETHDAVMETLALDREERDTLNAMVAELHANQVPAKE